MFRAVELASVFDIPLHPRMNRETLRDEYLFLQSIPPSAIVRVEDEDGDVIHISGMESALNWEPSSSENQTSSSENGTSSSEYDSSWSSEY